MGTNVRQRANLHRSCRERQIYRLFRQAVGRNFGCGPRRGNEVDQELGQGRELTRYIEAC